MARLSFVRMFHLLEMTHIIEQPAPQKPLPVRPGTVLAYPAKGCRAAVGQEGSQRALSTALPATIIDWWTRATFRQLISVSGQKRTEGLEPGGTTLSVQKEDYRTNRADYVIAAMHGRATADDGRNERLKALWLRDRRIARLAANPCESLPGPRRPNRAVR